MSRFLFSKGWIVCIFLLGLAAASTRCNKFIDDRFIESLQDPCGQQMNLQAPDVFEVIFGSQYGDFIAKCHRDLAPVWVDRIYNLVLNGYYDENYFFRVLNETSLKIIQFGTNGNPSVSNVYNFNSPRLGACAIIEPQPPSMPIGTPSLSNVFGTISMSTSYNDSTGTTWNATAELFINTGNNSRLDSMLFVPVCTISPEDMNDIVLKFPSFGEVEELGGTGPSLDKLYSDGNDYIASNPLWDSMAITTKVRANCPQQDKFRDNMISVGKSSYESELDASWICGPCRKVTNAPGHSANIDIQFPYSEYVNGAWRCPLVAPVDSCFVQTSLIGLPIHL